MPTPPTRVITVLDDGLAYPVGTRLDVDRTAHSGVELGVRLNPDGPWRVLSTARVAYRGATMLRLLLEPAPRS